MSSEGFGDHVIPGRRVGPTPKSLRGRTATQRSEKGSEKGSGEGSQKGFEQGACCGFYSKPEPSSQVKISS